MTESNSLANHELKLHSHHPDLLVIQEPTRPMVHSVFSQSSAEIHLKLGDHRLVHVLDVLLRFCFHFYWEAFAFHVDWGQHRVVVDEKGDCLIKVSDSIENSLHEIVVCLLCVL